MVDGKYVVASAHELQCMVKKLDMLKIVVPDKFVARGIIAKLPPSWRDFATTLKHKGTEISVSDLISSLDIEEKGLKMDDSNPLRVKPVHQPYNNDNDGKGKGKNNKPKETITF